MSMQNCGGMFTQGFGLDPFSWLGPWGSQYAGGGIGVSPTAELIALSELKATEIEKSLLHSKLFLG